MKIKNIQDMKRGWLIGDFEPSILQTKDFEVGILTHKKGEFWSAHLHKESEEYNLLLDGKMEINGVLIEPGTIFIIEKNEISKPEFLEDCRVLVVKVPSLPGDKYEV
jgi:mannose-6-phosphate isomerase-like protein (cupin superfamily)